MGDNRILVLGLFVILIGSIGYSSTQPADAGILRTWDGGAGTSNWSDANNWNPNGVPASDDVIIIDGNGGLNTVVHLNIDFTLTAGGSLTIDSGDSLVIDGGKTLTNDLSNIENNGNITVEGTLINSNSSFIKSTFFNNGMIDVNTSGVLSNNRAGEFTNNDTIINNGIFTSGEGPAPTGGSVSNNGVITNNNFMFGENGFLNNNLLGVINNNGNFDMSFFLTLDNKGIFNNNVAGTITTFQPQIPNTGTINNEGLIVLENFATNFENDGTVNNKVSGIITITDSANFVNDDLINNEGLIENFVEIENNGILNNICEGLISPLGIISGIGVINEIPCQSTVLSFSSSTIVSSSSTTTAVSHVITIDFYETNDGSVPLTAVSVTSSDPLCKPVYADGDANNIGVLDVGEQWHYLCYFISSVAGTFGIDLTGTGTAPNGDIITWPGDPEEQIELTVNVVERLPCGLPESAYDAVIDGDSDSNVLMGTSGNDLIRGFGGDDTITGFQGDDCIIGGNGNDILRGSAGNDVVYGGEGDDTISGGDDDDKLLGNNGNDRIFGLDGEDLIDGGSGNDIINGGNDNDVIFAGDGEDMVDGFMGDDFVRGGNDNDTLIGGQGNDVVLGDDGDDSIDGHIGDDDISGGAGTGDVCTGGPGTDSIDLVTCETVN